MTITTTTNTRERQARIADLWQRRPEWSEAEVIEAVDAGLALEADRQAETDARSREMARSFDSMLACPICGTNALGTGLCSDCGTVRRLIEAERAAAKPVNGQDRRALVEAWMERNGR